MCFKRTLLTTTSLVLSQDYSPRVGCHHIFASYNGVGLEIQTTITYRIYFVFFNLVYEVLEAYLDYRPNAPYFRYG